MTYIKFIRYGNNLEVYEYEKEPILLPRTGRKRKKNDGDKDMGIDGENTLSDGQLGKRQSNARRASVAFRRLVASNLQGTEFPVLVTITYAENITDIKIGYKDYRSFVQALRYKFGKHFRYICVPEFQKRGAVHFHALFWGLPPEVVLQERKTRTLAMIWAKGFVYLKQTDGHQKLSTYLAKYMSKTFVDGRLRNQKSYVSSRNIERPVIGRDIYPIWPVINDFQGDKEVETEERSYQTQWLGTCKHRLFKIIE